MDTMVLQVIMWICSILLVPALAYAFKRIRELELKMETRVSTQDAAKMIKESNDKFDKRFDKLEELILDRLTRG